MIINTSKGPVSLIDPTPALIRAIQSLLPFGMVGLSQQQKGAKYGLAMQCGQTEIIGVKQQPPDCDDKSATTCFQANSILVTHSLAGYLKQGFSGLMLPCVYQRKKENQRAEVGIAYFAYPSPTGHEVQEYPPDPAYDNQFGHGFTQMMVGFIRALQQSSKETGITLQPTIGLDVRRRMQLGSLAFGFMLVGPQVICLKTVVAEQDPAWTILRGTGIEAVYHLPSIPIAIQPEDLRVSKPTLPG
jgi:hypothetical protein